MVLQQLIKQMFFVVVVVVLLLLLLNYCVFHNRFWVFVRKGNASPIIKYPVVIYCGGGGGVWDSSTTIIKLAINLHTDKQTGIFNLLFSIFFPLQKREHIHNIYTI